MEEQIIDVIEEPTEETIPVEEENVIVNTGGTQNYNDLYNKPKINNVELIGNKSLSDLGIDQDFVKDDNYVHTDNNYTSQEKNKLASLENYDDTEVKSDIEDLQENKADKSEIPDVSSFITKDANNLTYYTLKTDTGSLIDLEMNSSTYVVTLTLKDQDGNSISTDSIDLPLETVVVGGRYDSASKKVILVLENGNEIEFSVADLVAGLQTEITSSNKLASDLVDDTNQTNKFVTSNEKQSWNAKVDTSTMNTAIGVETTNRENADSNLQGQINNKQNKTTISTDTTSTTVSLTLADNHEYRYEQDLASLTLTMPSGDFIASIVFASGSTPTSMTYDSSIKWSGNDVSSNAFVPQANMEYEIVFWYNGLSVNAVVRGVV